MVMRWPGGRRELSPDRSSGVLEEMTADYVVRSDVVNGDAIVNAASTTCTDCGATIPPDAVNSPCWLCAYRVQADLPHDNRFRGNRPTRHFFQSTYYLILAFVGLIGLGQVPEALQRGGDALVALVVYVGIAVVVFLAAHARAEQRIQRGQDAGYRARLLALLRSAAITFLVVIALVFAVFVALFIACMVAIGRGF